MTTRSAVKYFSDWEVKWKTSKNDQFIPRGFNQLHIKSYECLKVPWGKTSNLSPVKVIGKNTYAQEFIFVVALTSKKRIMFTSRCRQNIILMIRQRLSFLCSCRLNKFYTRVNRSSRLHECLRFLTHFSTWNVEQC